MINFPRTSAPRSSVIHGLGQSGRVTICGRTIGDNWAGEYSPMPTGAISCGRCLSGIDPRDAGPVDSQSADEARDLAAFDAQQARLRRDVPAYVAGQRVGILTGVQSVNGPHIGQYGTVVRSEEFWTGVVDYVVRADDGTEAVYSAGLLVSVPSDGLTRTMRGPDTFNGGWSVRRVHHVTPLMRVIMAARRVDALCEWTYVVATHYLGADEWTNGHYTDSMVTADRAFRTRVASWE